MNHRQFARDIIAFCRSLGVERAAFCGESTGAILHLSLALDAPELAAACILAGGTYYFDDGVRADLQQETPDTIDEGWRANAATVPYGARTRPLAQRDRGACRPSIACPHGGFSGGGGTPRDRRAGLDRAWGSRFGTSG